MAVTWYTQSGTPADSVGTDGDMSFDYTGRIQWGPRGLKTAGSWQNTAVNAVGPTGPGVLGGTGAPASTLGVSGNVYVDTTGGNLYLKGASSWSLTGQLPAGPTGAQGFTSLTQFAMGLGPQAAANALTLSTTAQALSIAGTTMPCYFVPSTASALMGAAFYQGGSACTIALYDVTASATVYSFALSTATQATAVFASTAYPMTANHVYQWQVTGSGTGTLQVSPFYLLPSGQITAGTGIVQGFTSATGTALSTTVQYLGPGPKTSTSNSYTRGYGVTRTGAILSMTGLYVPSATGAATATCTFTLYSYNISAQTVATVTTFTATNNSQPQTTTPASPITLSTGFTYFIGVTGSGSGQVDAQLNVIV